MVRVLACDFSCRNLLIYCLQFNNPKFFLLIVVCIQFKSGIRRTLEEKTIINITSRSLLCNSLIKVWLLKIVFEISFIKVCWLRLEGYIQFCRQYSAQGEQRPKKMIPCQYFVGNWIFWIIFGFFGHPKWH